MMAPKPKTNRPADDADDSGGASLSSVHVKNLMLMIENTQRLDSQMLPWQIFISNIGLPLNFGAAGTFIDSFWDQFLPAFTCLFLLYFNLIAHFNFYLFICLSF